MGCSGSKQKQKQMPKQNKKNLNAYDSNRDASVSNEQVMFAYVIDAALPLVAFVLQHVDVTQARAQERVQTLKQLAWSWLGAAPTFARHLQSKRTLRQLIDTLPVAANRAGAEKSRLSDVIREAEENFAGGSREPMKRESSTLMREEMLNLYLRNYVTNCQKLLEKKNTIADQLQINVQIEPNLLKKRENN